MGARLARIKDLHRDERGTISILTVFALLMFTMLLLMVTNVARHADDKIRMQNAADAATQTGAVVMARGMNSIAFTNHLLCEVFALTAYMREAQAAEQGTASLVPEILEEWRKTGQAFEQAGESAGYGKFQRLGAAIQQKVPLEQAVVEAYLLMSAEHSRMTLPVLEYILGGPDWQGAPPQGQAALPPDPLGGFIPRFQRAVIQHVPRVAHLAAEEIARRHGARVEDQHDDRPLESRLWRTDVQMLGQGRIDEVNPFQRTLPVVDPSPSGLDSAFSRQPYPGDPRYTYYRWASSKRKELAEHYLERWINAWMGDYFDFNDDNNDFVVNGSDPAEGMTTAKMSNLINLWRSATCAHLNQLLNEEYPLTNLPHLIRSQPGAFGRDSNQTLESEYTYVGVVYWPHLTEMGPGLFRNPLERDLHGEGDSLAFTQATLYIPRPRFVEVGGSWVRLTWVRTNDGWRQVPGPRYDWSSGWNMFHQNWMARIVPATSDSIVHILQQNPGGSAADFQPPRLEGVSMEEIRAVNTH